MSKALAIRFIEYMKAYRDDPLTRKAVIDAFVIDNDLRERFYIDYVLTDRFNLQLITLQ